MLWWSHVVAQAPEVPQFGPEPMMLVVTMVTMFFDHPEDLLELWRTLVNFGELC